MSRRANRPQPAQIEQYLYGIQYPARKQDIVQRAEDNEAPGDVMAVLNEIPDREYADAVDFAKGLGKVEQTPEEG